MADITLCNGTNCRDKETCVRFTTPGDELYQSMFDPSVDEEKDKDSCVHYIKDRRKGIKVDERETNK